MQQYVDTLSGYMQGASILRSTLGNSGAKALLVYDDWTPRYPDPGYWILHSMFLQGDAMWIHILGVVISRRQLATWIQGPR